MDPSPKLQSQNTSGFTDFSPLQLEICSPAREFLGDFRQLQVCFFLLLPFLLFFFILILTIMEVRFGEPPDLDSQELFGWISAFISEFRKACSEVTLRFALAGREKCQSSKIKRCHEAPKEWIWEGIIHGFQRRNYFCSVCWLLHVFNYNNCLELNVWEEKEAWKQRLNGCKNMNSRKQLEKSIDNIWHCLSFANSNSIPTALCELGLNISASPELRGRAAQSCLLLHRALQNFSEFRDIHSELSEIQNFSAGPARDDHQSAGTLGHCLEREGGRFFPCLNQKKVTFVLPNSLVRTLLPVNLPRDKRNETEPKLAPLRVILHKKIFAEAIQVFNFTPNWLHLPRVSTHSITAPTPHFCLEEENPIPSPFLAALFPSALGRAWSCPVSRFFSSKNPAKSLLTKDFFLFFFFFSLITFSPQASLLHYSV
ncbi:hypothetical protein Nmel_015175 [Mimus melanotis]